MFLVMIASWLLLLTPPEARAEVADRLISVVGEGLVTQSDLDFERAFAPLDHSPVPAFEAPDADPLQRLEDYRRLRQLAGDLLVFRPPPDAVDARVQAVRDAFLDEARYRAFLTRWGLDEAGLREQVYARLVVERYVERNLGVPAPGDRPEDWVTRYEAWMAPRRAAQPALRVGP